MRSAPFLPLAIAATLAACDQPPPTQQPIHENPIRIELGTIPRNASPGETVVFIATAYNSDPFARRIGLKCGPAMDVAVRFPNQSQVSMVAVEHGPGLDSLCDPEPEHYVPANGTLVVEFRLVVPEERGYYYAWAGARGQYGLHHTSPVVRIDVR